MRRRERCEQSVVPEEEEIPAKKSSVEKEKDRVAAIFKVVDVDGSGTIDAEELRPMLARLGWIGKVAEVLVKLDKDQSGTVDFDELITWWLKEGRRQRRWFFRGNHNAAAKNDRLDLRREALRLLEADARHEAENTARDAFRRNYPPRQSCAVCGHASCDADSALKHQIRQEPTSHGRWMRHQATASRRRDLLDRARERARRESGKFLFPTLYVYDARVSQHVELQTYDIPDTNRGRPTGVLNLRSGAVYCAGDGDGTEFDFLRGEAASEWLRVLWPAHAAGGGGSVASNVTLEVLRNNVAQRTVKTTASTTTTTETRRNIVWVRNRSIEFAKGRQPVLRQLKCGPSTIDAMVIVPRRRRRCWRSAEGGKKKSVPLAKKEEREEEERKRLLGDEVAYMCSLGSLSSGTDVTLWEKPMWYRTAPSLPTASRIKVRAIPELHAAIIGEIKCGESVLVFGESGDWLVGTFGDRDNAWFLARSKRREFLVEEE